MTEPNDDFEPLSVPRTEEQLIELRRCAVEDAVTFGWPRSMTFTCDDCASRFTCALVFDPYNVDGDCLMEK